MKHSYSITGMTCDGCVATVKEKIESHSEIISADVSLENQSAIIEMSNHISTSDLQNLIGGDSKYKITMANEQLSTDDQMPDEETNLLKTYSPLILIFLFIGMVSGIASFDAGQLNLMEWMNFFMAGFFITFSFFKFLNLKGFAESYAMYDLLAMRVKSYGYLYPFIELALGIAFLTHFDPQITYITTIVVMGFSSIGVIKSVLDKKKIRCACLGAVFNLPMSTVTIIEDLLMVGMAFFMLWSI